MIPSTRNVPSDTFFALELLSEECAVHQHPCFVSQSQIYNFVPCRTTVEQELDALRCNGLIRLFHLKTDRQDVAVLFKSEYDADLLSAAHSRSAADREVLLKFKECVTDVVCDDRISKEDLAERMGTSEEPVRNLEGIRLLQSLGLLIDSLQPNSSSVGTFQLWSPRLGMYVTSLIEGRKQLLKIFQRQKYKEISASRLFEMQLRQSRLNMKYHIRDLMGLDLIKELQTPGGKFYKLCPKSSH